MPAQNSETAKRLREVEGELYDLKLNVIGFVIREWQDAYDEAISKMSETEVEASLRRWHSESHLLEVCDLTADETVEWWREYIAVKFN